MSEKGQYKTKQMNEMTSYLESLNGEHFTVHDLTEYFKSKGSSIGTTTIYRRLDRMVEQGLVAKYMMDGNSSACFQYTGSGTERSGETCYHCKCEICGKLVHLHCDEVSHLKEHILKDHDFELNPTRTVFYGICAECRKA